MRRFTRHTFQRSAVATGLSLAATGLGAARPALAAPAAQGLAAGAVVALAGTPHLFVADERGELHWAGDTRALAGRTVAWNTRQEVSLEQLRGMRRGAPWLSAGLLKMGEPIYLVKWESDWAQPQLLRIQNIADVSLFGIDESNYGQLVLDETTWRQRFPFDPNALTKGTLSAATGVPTAAPAATLVARRTQQYVGANGRAVHEVEITGATPGTRLQVRGTYDQADVDFQGTRLGSSTKHTFGPEDAGPVTPQGTLRWRREHPIYTGAIYTFTDPAGNSVSITFFGD
jgi:hypothetical protein